MSFNLGCHWIWEETFIEAGRSWSGGPCLLERSQKEWWEKDDNMEKNVNATLFARERRWEVFGHHWSPASADGLNYNKHLMNTCWLCVLCTGAQARPPLPGCHTCLPAALEFWPPGAHSSPSSLEAQIKRAAPLPANDWLIKGYKGWFTCLWVGSRCSMLQTHPLWIRQDFGYWLHPFSCPLCCLIPSSPSCPQQITWVWMLVSGSALGRDIWCHELSYKNGLVTHHEATRTCLQWWADPWYSQSCGSHSVGRHSLWWTGMEYR